MSSSDKHKLDVARNNCFIKIFNACWRESAKPLLFYCGTLPVSLLVDQRKIFFYNMTLRSTNIVLRVVCRLHLCEAQRLCSVYHVFPGHIGNILSGPFGLALLAYPDFDFIVFLLIFLL